MKQRRIIITADDFGLTTSINEAVELAHREGILSCASLMMGADAVEDAVNRARRLPDLHIGLHVVLVDGKPVLPPEQVPDLVDADGKFDRRLVRAGFRFFFLPRVRRQLEAEIHAQFRAFHNTGLTLDHVNAHKHMHLHPTVLTLILRIGRNHGLHAIRVPYEPLDAARKISGPFLPWSMNVGHMLLQPWIRLQQRRIRRAGVCSNQFVFGLNTSGIMTEEKVLRILKCLPAGVSEIYFHPAVEETCQPPSIAEKRHQAEFRALTSPRVRAAFAAADIQYISFSEL